MKLRVKVTGLDAIERKLARLSQLAQKRVMEDALRAGGEVIAEEARRLVPVRTGHLRDTIEVVTDSTKGGGVKAARVLVGPDQNAGFYGDFVEFGTRRMAARPFMRPAFDTMADAAQDAVAAHLATEFDRLAKD